MINFKQVLIFLCGLCVLCGEACSDELRLKFQPGDKYYLSSVTEQKTTQVVDGNEKVMLQVSRIGCGLDIVEIDDNDCAWAKYTYKKGYISITKPNYNIEYDSDANQSKVPIDAMPMALAIGESLYLKISPDGRIIDIKGLTALIAAAKAAVPISNVRGMVQQYIEQTYSETVVRRSLEDSLAVFPPLKKDINAPDANLSGNDTWYRIIDLNDNQPRELVQWTYKLKERKGGIAYVDVNFNLTSDPNSGEVVTRGVKMEHEVSGKGGGSVEIDEATGRIINEKVTQDVTEEYKSSAKGPVLRVPPPAPPINTVITLAFQMTKRDEKSPESDTKPSIEPLSEPNSR